MRLNSNGFFYAIALSVQFCFAQEKIVSGVISEMVLFLEPMFLTRQSGLLKLILMESILQNQGKF
jgi:hypothetical protein